MIVWLATAPHERPGSGRFRRARPEHLLPWTREKDPDAARKLWDQLATATAADSPNWRRQGGLAVSGDQAPAGSGGSVAVEHDIPARAQR